MDITLVIVLVAIGILLLLAELFIFPGISVAGVGGAASLVGAVVMAYVRINPMAGRIVLLVSLVTLAAAIYAFMKFRTLDKMALKENIDAKVDLVSGTDVKVGDVGKTVSRLAPMGKVEVHGHVFEAKSLGNFVDEECGVKVIEVQGNILVVSRLGV